MSSGLAGGMVIVPDYSGIYAQACLNGLHDSEPGLMLEPCSLSI